ncbi:MAG TPA: hypothetical protein VN729_12880 [Ktedonobacteraceae bacterium]|nr:hypothetical protein [Ktedonobacteraceae bacterium]
MASVSTPDSPVVIVNPTPTLPSVSERTPAMVMSALESWPYWLDIKRVARKEYGMEPEKFDALLPEYQRYLALIMLGYTPLGMFSFAVDKIWHSHVLCSHLWADCCLQLHGSPINHVAQVPVPGENHEQMCTTCRSCRNCSGGGQGCDNAVPGGTAQEFAAAYFKAFGVQPSAFVWDLDEPEGCAAD